MVGLYGLLSLVNCFLKESTWIGLIIYDTNKVSIHKSILIVPTRVLNLLHCWIADIHIPLKKNEAFMWLYVLSENTLHKSKGKDTLQ